MAHDTSFGIVKGYKVTNGSRKRLIGIACSSLAELKIKGCQKLKIETDINKVEVLLNDGTIVDDDSYFRTLPSQTVLILKKPGEKILNGVDIIYGALKSFNVELLRTASRVRQFFDDDDTRQKIRILSSLLNEERERQRASLSCRSDDPEWFEDLETLAETKEEYMRKRSSGRIQRYFYDAKEKIRNSYFYCEDLNSRKCLDKLMDELYCQLKRDEFFACLFDRSTFEKGALCDQRGTFLCQGLWNSNQCYYITGDPLSDHRINPYCSKEQRVIFATWNLDHRIERSRAIVPSILKASEICCRNPEFRINTNYFYELLFTSKNLKLVHIVCHDKNEHTTAVCNYNQIVIKACNNVKNKKRHPSDVVNFERLGQSKWPKRNRNALSNSAVNRDRCS